MKKTDLTKLYKSYYTAKAKPELFTIEAARYVSITGKGDPSGALFADKTRALYATAYVLKFACKAKDLDFTVAKLEGLWRFDEKQYAGTSIHEAPQKIPRSEWEYRLLIRLPDFVSIEDLEKARTGASKKKELLCIEDVEFYHMHEGKVVQMLHTGSFDKEPETLTVMAEFMSNLGLMKNGTHHEIYLSDFRKTAPEKLKTILREPVK